jgi:hypothetical protein
MYASRCDASPRGGNEKGEEKKREAPPPSLTHLMSSENDVSRLRGTYSVGGAFVPRRSGPDLEVGSYDPVALESSNQFQKTHNIDGYRTRRYTKEELLAIRKLVQ